MELKPLTLFLGIVILFALFYTSRHFQTQSYNNISVKIGRPGKVEQFGDNKDSMNVTYEKNKNKADYQETASYTQKTNHGDFMYKDFTTALPPDFNRNKCPSLDAAANGGELL